MTRDIPNTTFDFRDILPTTRDHGEGNAYRSPVSLERIPRQGWLQL